MNIAHKIRIWTDNKYDIIDVLEMEPYRRRALVASLKVEAEDLEKKQKKGGS